eukprot:TRINITY_DN2790_c0_g1_i5.p1 TRINITY_DN2790_c0_g1~~TRINITY_DN2790_c0_g1_i5.p1  ORF type:complete len:570 (+),score=159.69 TRINITY_DN2790_c0_g1_i5:76-1785(+)
MSSSDRSMTDPLLPKPEVVRPGFFQRFSLPIDLSLMALVVAFFITSMVINKEQGFTQDKIVLGLLCAFIVLKLLFNHVPFTPITDSLLRIWVITVQVPLSRMGSTSKLVLGAICAVAIMVGVTFGLPVSPGSSRLVRLQSMFGLVVFLTLLVVTSKHRRHIAWRTVIVGLLMQFLLALFVLRSSVGYHIFTWLASFVSGYLEHSHDGYAFVFGTGIPGDGTQTFAFIGSFMPPLPANSTLVNVYGNQVPLAASFAQNVFPAIIFFCATVEILYYFGAIQWLIKKFATFFLHLMHISGAEAVVAAASPFIGQGENAMLVRPFINHMTKSEIHQIMTSGFATISGSVLYGYVALGVNPQYLITAAIMSVPCAIALSKIRYPETDEPLSRGKVEVPPRAEQEANFMQAAANGAGIGIHVSIIIIASLIAVLSLLSATNAFLSWLGAFVHIEGLALQTILKWPLIPFAWLMGVDGWSDIQVVAELLAVKLVANEFVAYEQFTHLANTLSVRSGVIITYALCGFANLSSIGMQIGVLVSLGPERKDDIASLSFSAMLTGAMSTCFSATIAGMLL